MALRVKCNPLCILDPQDKLVLNLRGTISKLRSENKQLSTALQRSRSHSGDGSDRDPEFESEQVSTAQQSPCLRLHSCTCSAVCQAWINLNVQETGKAALKANFMNWDACNEKTWILECHAGVSLLACLHLAATLQHGTRTLP